MSVRLTAAVHPRVICEACGSIVSLRRSGVLYQHRPANTWGDWSLKGVRCLGSSTTGWRAIERATP